MLRDSRPTLPTMARLLLACLLLVAGGLNMAAKRADTTGHAPLAASWGDPVFRADALPEASASPDEDDADAVPMPAESEPGSLGTRGLLTLASARSHGGTVPLPAAAPSHRPQHPGRGPPAA